MVEAFFAMDKSVQLFVALGMYGSSRLLATYVSKVIDRNESLRAVAADADHSKLERVSEQLTRIERRLESHIETCELRYKMSEKG